jgi:hypothetical protein
MEHDTDTLRRYADELTEIARLDHSYYLNKTPSSSDRASYALRQERLARVRNRFKAELTLLQHQTRIPTETFQVRVKEAASGAELVSSPQCMLVHDLNNHLGVLLGRCELLRNLKFQDEGLEQHLSRIVDAALKMASRIRGNGCTFLNSESSD